ncbi:hypothetical protein JCM3765_005491 [Sporobolomyces pararoseus]
MYWKGYTRERAALEILDVSHRLSQKAWVFRPFDDQVKQQAVEDLELVRGELFKLGYAPQSDVLVTIDRVVSTLEALSPSRPSPFTAVLDLSQLLLSTVKFLSLSSSPFPIPNRHLPPEILHNIYDYVVLNQYHATRQRTVSALSRTSTLWRQIVDERPVVYLPSDFRLEVYSNNYLNLQEAGSPRLLHPWEEVHIDLSQDSDPVGVYDGWWEEMVEPLLDMRKSDKLKRHVGRLVLVLPTNRDTPLNLWADQIVKTTNQWNRVSLQLPLLMEEHYRELWRVLYVGEIGAKEERSYEFGDSYLPMRLEMRTTQTIIDGASNSRKALGGEDGRVPVFTNYTVFAAPWLVFTTPIFLLETVPEEDRPTTLPPSRLRHLELSFQVDPTNPAQAIQEIESFFSTIAPRIEHLVFRLRLTRPHTSSFEESKFTHHFISGLLSCTRLDHLSIGGFGFAPDLLSRLSGLPIRSLTILPLQYVENYSQYLPLIHTTPPNQIRKITRATRCKGGADAYRSWIEEIGVYITCLECEEERVMWRTLARAAGVAWT